MKEEKTMWEKFVTDHWAQVTAVLAVAFGFGKGTQVIRNQGKRIKKLEDRFVDGDGNERILTIVSHKEFCDLNQRVVCQKIDNLIATVKEEKDDQKEIFQRLASIETSVGVVQGYVEAQNNHHGGKK